MQLIFADKDPYDPSTYEAVETNDVLATLYARFNGRWPATARLYENEVSEANDITPQNHIDIERLASCRGRVYCIVYPGDFVSLVVAIVAVAASAAVAFLFQPKIPTVQGSQDRGGSSNNELSERQNKSNINGRIPDIFGQVRSTPDLIAQPYKFFEKNIEVEEAVMCVGRGQYAVADIRDDTTAFWQIDGASVAVYEPFTSPNFGSPSTIIGPYVAKPLAAYKRYTSVNGQVLQGPNYKTVAERNDFEFEAPNAIHIDVRAFNFNDLYQAGDEVVVTSPHIGGSRTVTVTSASIDRIFFNTNWASSGKVVGSIRLPGTFAVGPFISDDADASAAILNFVAPSGQYFIDENGNVYTRPISVNITINRLDAFDTIISSSTTSHTLPGSIDKSQQGYTITIPLGFRGRFSASVVRTSEVSVGQKGTYAEEIRWRDLYSSSPITQPHFGNVTTIVAKTYATTGALAVKSRKLNLLATRKVPTWRGGASFSAPVPSTRAADIFVAVARDPYIGRRSVAELDLASIYGTEGEINVYFGTSEASAFSYTFDNSNVSFEETLTTIADSVFCTAYRRGSVIKLSFERETPNSVLLFNHRNKLPGTETRTVRFGNQNEYDGVKVTWIDPVDDSVATITLPMGGDPVNSNDIESVGIRNYRQAWFFAHRAWNKIRYQNTLVEFEATHEADLLIIRDRILLADNTRAEVIDGQVEGAEGLTLTLSRPVAYAGGMSILLQHWDGSVESIPLVGSDGYNVTLQRAPKQSLSVDEEAYAKATFAIVSSAMDRTVGPFLLTERNPSSSFNSQIVAINYDSRYYQNDKDWINGVI